MKLKHLAVVTALSSMAFIGCDSKDKNETEVTTADTTQTEMADMATVANQASTEGTSVTITDADVPAEVKTTFTAKYPKVTTVNWMKYQPGANDDFEMDQTYYYVRFNNDGSDYITWYNNRGEWVKTSTPIVGGSSKLPAAVNKYITDNYPGYTIEEISLENDKDMDMYEIKLNKGEEKVKIKVLPSGEIFKKK